MSDDEYLKRNMDVIALEVRDKINDLERYLNISTPKPDIQKEIAELKEHDIFKIWNSRRGSGKATLLSMLVNGSEILNIKEVLREFIRIELNRMEWDTEAYNDTKKLLAKLDSGGEKEKDGLDKSGIHEDFHQSKGEGSLTDSKQPEPFRVVATKVYKEVVADIIANEKKGIQSMDKPREDDVDWKAVHSALEKEYMRIGKLYDRIQFQLHDGIIVKREDLQLLIEWAGIRMDKDEWEEMQRIKEEYKID